MKAFFDTSALVKKYIDEPGRVEFDKFIEHVSQIVVAPTYVIEMFGLVNRKVREKIMTVSDADRVKNAVLEHYIHFENVIFSVSLQQKAVDLIDRYPLTSLDAIQLASAAMAGVQTFVTSDKQLFKCAVHEIKNVKLI